MSTSLITEAQSHIVYIGGDWPRGMKRPDWIAHAARASGLTKSAVERILYGKRKRLFADELLTLRERRIALQERRARGETAYAELAARAGTRGCAGPDEGLPQSFGRGGAALLGGGDHREAIAEVAAAGLAASRPAE